MESAGVNAKYLGVFMEFFKDMEMLMELDKVECICRLLDLHHE